MPDELNFSSVDDLASANARGLLPEVSAGRGFVPLEIGPLVELASIASGKLLRTDWLMKGPLESFRDALARGHQAWSSEDRMTGLLRTVFDPSIEEDTAVRFSFFQAASRAARTVGFTDASQSLAAALREMESNIHEHSGSPESGLLVFSARGQTFEFVVTDYGVGVLASLRRAAEHRTLGDHGDALSLALEDGVSRYGRTADHGHGFRDLFRGLEMLNADLRFRSGDHALTIAGERPELKRRQLAQKPHYQGFLVSARCSAISRA